MQSSEQVDGFVFEQLRDPIVEARDAGRAAAEMRQDAYDEGHGAGYAAGLAEAREQTHSAAAALAELLVEARAEATQRAHALEREAVELALALAEKVVSGAVAVEPERVLEVVRGALRRIAERPVVTVLVNPADMELVRASIEAVAASLGGVERIDVQEDRRVGRGGALLRTPVGEIDARLASQLERARELVERELAT